MTAALMEFHIALQNKSDFPQAVYELADQMLGQGQTEDALGLLSHVVPLRYHDARSHYQLALALRRAGQDAEAQAEFQKAQRLDPALKPPH